MYSLQAIDDVFRSHMVHSVQFLDLQHHGYSRKAYVTLKFSSVGEKLSTIIMFVAIDISNFSFKDGHSSM